MKKIYSSPETRVVTIALTQMISQSPNGSKVYDNNNANSGYDVLGKGRGYGESSNSGMEPLW